MTTLDTIVRNACANVGDTQAVKTYIPMLRCAAMAVKDTNLNITPSVKSFMAQADDNLSLVVPQDCLNPFTAIKVLPNGCAYPLGRIEGLEFRPDDIIPQSEWCPESTENTTSDHCFRLYNFPGSAFQDFFFMNHYYGEVYGYSESRFYGFWAWDRTNGRMLFESGGCVQPGDTIAVSYEAQDDTCKVIPSEMEMILFHYTLGIYFSSTAPLKADYHIHQFKRHLRNYNHKKIKRVSRQDILDAITRGYRSAVY